MSGWSLVFDNYDPEQEQLREALCTLGNGYVATRGASCSEVASTNHYPGTYFAGVYNRLVSEIAGERIENEDLVNWPNWLVLRLRPEGEDWLSLDTVEILSYRQELSLREGVLQRDIRFRHGNGRVTRTRERRLVSMHDAHVAAVECEVTAENWTGSLTLRSALDGDVRNTGVARYRDLANRHIRVTATDELSEDTVRLVARASQSRIEVAQAARTRVYRDGSHVVPVTRSIAEPASIGQELDIEVHEGVALQAEKIVGLYTSRDRGISEPCYQADRLVQTAGRFDDILIAHAQSWQSLWDEFDLRMDTPGNSETELKLRVHIFHLLQTVSPFTPATDAGVPARGWHGEAYRGHVFWDEIFILPLLNLRMPLLTRALLRYRYRRLREARRLASEAGFEGAMFPWQSGSDGREESQRIHLNPQSGRWTPDVTHLQRHINSAIAWCVWQYYEVTSNQEFLSLYGAEMFLEIARFWASIAEHDDAGDRYEIRGVIGPDEFHTAYPDREDSEPGVNNNAYTNVMAAWVLTRAGDILERLSPHRKRSLVRRLGIGEAELERWDRISRRLKVVFHGDNIISQFEGYADLEELDWDAYREKYGDIQRLDRILESEGDSPNRYKLSKQADVLMLFYLFSTEELTGIFDRLGYAFDADTIRRNIDYYAERTTDGSTLSHIVRSWVQARSDRETSWCRFQEALNVDLADVQGGTTSEGIHLGAMAGTVDMLHRCYTGLETRDDVLFFSPTLPADVRELRLSVRYRQQRIFVRIDHNSLLLDSTPARAAPISVSCNGDVRTLRPGESTAYELT
ncbi:MAG: glycoside hydrolase family 65 protein [Gammaproteobacteria bacterium]|nr:glycoside hydrolase family 65 protein [Gammaproteobacteria bacterium]